MTFLSQSSEKYLAYSGYVLFGYSLIYFAITCFSPNDSRMNGFRFCKCSTVRPSFRFWRESNFKSQPFEALKFGIRNSFAISSAFVRINFEESVEPVFSASSKSMTIRSSISGNAEARILYLFESRRLSSSHLSP